MENPDIVISIVEDDTPIVLSINEEDPEVSIKLDESGNLPPVYEGETTVVPKAFVEQTLDTKDHILLDDIIVLEIPYASVSNPAGGYTVSIDS